MHSVADQIANTWEIFGFRGGDDVERSGNRINSFHHVHLFEGCRNFVGFTDCGFDEDVCTRSQLISPLISGAILFVIEQGCQSQLPPINHTACELIVSTGRGGLCKRVGFT